MTDLASLDTTELRTHARLLNLLRPVGWQKHLAAVNAELAARPFDGQTGQLALDTDAGSVGLTAAAVVAAFLVLAAGASALVASWVAQLVDTLGGVL